MDTNRKDSIGTIVAIGLLSYASADIAHHVFGHGAACLALGGRIISLSSVFVQCSIRGATIDLAGPFASLVIGLAALLVARMAKRAASATRLFFILAAAFNLLWFALQFVFSAATGTDDWAWAMHQLHIAEPIRYGMIVFGALAYVLMVRLIATQLAPYAHPRGRLWTIVLTAWLSAGALACATAAFDQNADATLFRKAAEQSLGLSLGLLFVPSRAARLPCLEGMEATVLGFSIPWVVAAVVVGTTSILVLGPGIAI